MVKGQGVECVQIAHLRQSCDDAIWTLVWGILFADARENCVQNVCFKKEKATSNRLQVCWYIKSQS